MVLDGAFREQVSVGVALALGASTGRVATSHPDNLFGIGLNMWLAGPRLAMLFAASSFSSRHPVRRSAGGLTTRAVLQIRKMVRYLSWRLMFFRLHDACHDRRGETFVFVSPACRFFFD